MSAKQLCHHSSYLKVLPLTLEGVFFALNPLAVGNPREHLQTVWWPFLLQLPWFLLFGYFVFPTSKWTPVLNRWCLLLPSSQFTAQVSSPLKGTLRTFSFRFTYTQKSRVETANLSLHCSSGLSAAALPMIRHLILLLVRGQSWPRHVSCQSHSLCPATCTRDLSPEHCWK